MTYYKIVCMEGFAERLSWAMKCAGFDPAKDQSRLATLVGPPCKPQNIQHLLDPNKEVASSKYTLDLAEKLGCDPFWLGKGKGVKPELVIGVNVTPFKYEARARNETAVASPTFTHYLWPFTRFTFEEYKQLDDSIKDSVENLIAASVKNRGDPEKLPTPAPNAATG